MKSMPAFIALGSSVPGAVVWNQWDKSADITLSGSDLIATRASGASGYRGVRSTGGKAYTGDGYFEVALTVVADPGYLVIGIATASATLSDKVGSDAYGWGYYGEEGGKKYNSGTGTAYGSDFVQGDIIGVAFKNGKVWFAKNNTWNGSPTAGTGEAFSGITGTIYPMVTLYHGGTPVDVIAGRFKSADFSYSPPSGFAAWDAT
jgi:hypothetical protein